MLIAIYAEDLNHNIGLENKMPWYIPKDLIYFKEKTLNQIVVMGRKTFKSLNYKPLLKRKNIILTKNKEFNYFGIEVFNSKIELLADYNPKDIDLYIIGGKAIFSLFKNEYDLIYRTIIQAKFEGDVKMFEIDRNKYQLVSQKYQPITLENEYSLIFETWKKY